MWLCCRSVNYITSSNWLGILFNVWLQESCYVYTGLMQAQYKSTSAPQSIYQVLSSSLIAIHLKIVLVWQYLQLGFPTNTPWSSAVALLQQCIALPWLPPVSTCYNSPMYLLHHHAWSWLHRPRFQRELSCCEAVCATPGPTSSTTFHGKKKPAHCTVHAQPNQSVFSYLIRSDFRSETVVFRENSDVVSLFVNCDVDSSEWVMVRTMWRVRAKGVRGMMALGLVGLVLLTYQGGLQEDEGNTAWHHGLVQCVLVK